MTVVQNTATDPGGEPLSQVSVRISLVTGTSATPGYTASGDISATYTTSTTQAGFWTANLTPNSAITPANTYYQVIEGSGAVSNIVVPASGGPYTLAQLLVTPPPTPGAVGITGLQIATAGTVEGVRPEVNLIAGAGVAITAADNPGSNRVDVTVTAGDAPVYNVLEHGATGNGTTDDTTALQAVIGSIAAAGGGVMWLPPGTYRTTGLLLNGMSNFTVAGSRAAVLQMAPNTMGAPNQGYANVLTLVGCTDFAIEDVAIDGRRDTLFPIIPLAANAASGQATVQVAHGASSTLVVGQRVSVLGGLTANGGADANLQDQFLTVQTIIPGAGSANDTVVFTGNLGNAYHSAAGTVSDGYGPYAANGAYITPWQNGNATVAGLTLAAEDQQNGIHLIGCTRFRITGCEIHNLWESPIRCGTHNLTGLAQTQGAAYGTIDGNALWHGYDQGVGLWCSANITVTGNVVTAAGWAGISLTGSDRCTVTGNSSCDNVQAIPGDTNSGYGVAVEGGGWNTITGNTFNNNYGCAALFTALGTLPFASPAQLATTVASNSLALPAATIALASIPAGWATSGQFTALSSQGAQQISYTGISGNNLTGCTGGLGTLYTGARAVQYPLFTANGAALPIGSTTSTVSNGALVQPGGRYSLVDGPRTERCDVLTVTGNMVTFTAPTTYQHADKCQIGQAVPEGNQYVGNTSTGGATIDAGVKLAAAVRTTILGNTIHRAGLRGIDGIIWAAGGVQPPCGTKISKNTITAPDATGDGAAYSAIAFAQCTDVQISDNNCGGAILGLQGYYVSIFLQAVTGFQVKDNLVADCYGVGIELNAVNEYPCTAGEVSGNQVLRTQHEGMILYGGQALQVSGNLVKDCAPNSGGGYGGGMDIRGVQGSLVTKNTVHNCGHGGFTLDTASINGANVYTGGNILAQNIARSDGNNYDILTGGAQQMGTGFSEANNAQGPNSYYQNTATGCSTNWNIQSTGNKTAGNTGYNPVGKFGAQPAVPASGTPYTNILNADAAVFITGGTVTAVSIGGQATGLTGGAFRVPAGQSITLTYSAAPTWVWFGD